MDHLAPDILFFAGSPVMVSPLALVRSHAQVKRHRRKRINKKWLKRYGRREIWTPGAIWNGANLVVHPLVFAELEKRYGVKHAKFTIAEQ